MKTTLFSTTNFGMFEGDVRQLSDFILISLIKLTESRQNYENININDWYEFIAVVTLLTSELLTDVRVKKIWFWFYFSRRESFFVGGI